MRLRNVFRSQIHWFVVIVACICKPAMCSDNISCDRTRRILTEPFGEISHGPNGSNYTQDSHCEWLIKAESKRFITLSFKLLHTECSYDYIFVYDGDSFQSPLLGSFSGKTEPQQIVASSGYMLILLYSDTNYVLDGFRAEYSITDCPNNCTNKGMCIEHKCVCQGNWISDDCSQDACPENCGSNDGRGICNNDHCECLNGYTGQSCSLAAKKPVTNEWHWLSPSQPILASAAHTAVYLNETDSLYVFGGYNLNEILDSLHIYRFASNMWESELGIPLHNTQMSRKIDKHLLRAVLQEDDMGTNQYGLNKKASFFGNFLLSALSENENVPIQSHQRRSSDDFVVLDEILETIRPSARYGHAAVRYKSGFVIYGGKLASGNLSNELWYYNVSKAGGQGVWSLRAMNSQVKPPPLTRHSLTLAGEEIYLFGGSLETDEFSSRLFKIKLFDNTSAEQWQEVKVRGGKSLDVRIVSHTTNYHQPSNSLIVYGGIVAGVARFSKLSDRMFAFQLDQRQWTEIMYPRTSLRDAYIPRERAFHTTTLIGNYLIVFGGYTHRHNKEEICYDNQMYLYHLGCHSWINQDVLGISANPKRSRYPKQQGVFAHAADIRQNNTLLIFGGYHGNMNGDLLAYTLPAMLAVNEDPEAVCVHHLSVNECLSNPECGWCSADGLCYGRTIGANCTTNLQTTRCPGICPALGDCHSCLIHGNLRGNFRSVASKLGLGLCSWCVQNARCHFKEDRTVCGEETPSQDPGWWGSKGTEVHKPEMCTELDRRPGLTFIKYFHPVNWSLPDHVTVVNATMVDFQFSPSSSSAAALLDPAAINKTSSEEMISRLIGFIRPPSQWADSGQMLRMCASFSQAILRLGVGSNLKQLQEAGNLTAEQYTCMQAKWPRLQPNTKILVDFQASKCQKIGPSTVYHHHQQSKMGLQHNKSNENAKAFTFEYLEPFSTSSDTNRAGVCKTYDNCLHCLTDAVCGWCDLTSSCISRLEVESDACRKADDWKYLTLQPSHCENCSNFISCDSCVTTGLCEWWPEDARCVRKNRSDHGIKEVAQCPAPCHVRTSCTSCLNEKGRCVWCEAINKCFSFSIYTSEYQFGLCREWLDQPLPGGVSAAPVLSGLQQQPRQQQCKTCENHKNCTTCLRSLSCGWCYNQNNPIEGICMLGDFNKSFNDKCGAPAATSAQNSSWAYANCPDVDECGLGLHDCHKEAECTNTHGSFQCQCRKGFIGDGHRLCKRTCYENCAPHGHCSGEPDYQCKCDLGWTGRDCANNCGCHNHSTCNEKGIGRCDMCQEWTEGEFCERCSSGAYGNATDSEIGCKPCDCNGHGNVSIGVCDPQTGECYCQDNTEGLRCEVCNREYYGDPREGGKCYFQCESRGFLTNPRSQGFGSYQSYKPIWGGGAETRECLWIISAANMTTQLEDVIIELTIEEESMNITCGANALYVYEGLPDLTGAIAPQKQLLSVYCNEDSTPLTIDTRAGALTIHFKLGAADQGFNAVYTVHSCVAGTCKPPYICDAGNKKCTCPDGFSGTQCQLERCPGNCNANTGRGFCEKKYGRCVCQPEYGGADCSQRIESYHMVFTEPFNTQLLSDDNLEHLRKTLPRFGHTLVADRRGGLWMFGGYSMSHGPLNDIRQFDTKNNTWMQVTVDSTPNEKMPAGRYFHASDIVNSKQTIYVYGGLTTTVGRRGNKVLDDFWSFSIQTHRWVEVELDTVDVLQEDEVRPPPLLGHTLTYVRDPDQNQDSLLLVGGFNREQTQQNSEIFEFSLAQKRWKVVAVAGQLRPQNIYGHTSVFHQPTQVLYVYGGYLLQNGHTQMSSKLFAFNYKARKWTEMPTWQRLNSLQQNLPRARYLHSAIATENYMLVFGGRTNPLNITDVLVAYSFKCNQWIRLTQNTEFIGHPPTSSYAQAMAQDPESGAVYVVGGWDGKFQSKVTKILLPADLCQLWSFKKFACRNFYGCSYCSIKSESEDHSHCYSTGGDREKVCEEGRFRGTLMSNEGLSCSADELIAAARRCSDFATCRECLAVFPPTALGATLSLDNRTTPACQWCEKSNKCRDSSVTCENTGGSGGNETTTLSNGTLLSADQCPGQACLASGCQSCNALPGCSWAIEDDSSDAYKCVAPDSVDKSKFTIMTNCPGPCHLHQNCSGCLAATDAGCHWSTQLNECLAKSYQAVYCAGGTCGLVLTPNEQEFCPEPCGAYNECSTCLKHAHCGWCAITAGDGEGICTEGSLGSPSEYSTSVSCASIFLNRNRSRNITVAPNLTWHYVKCPPENECRNKHHDCDPVSQMCVDLYHGYECQCASGYKLENGICQPICLQGCVRGTCVKPNECSCSFGYVGANCSIQCQCNGHSNCAGPDKLAECLECHNETMGQQCDKCRPLFVGDPKNGGECVPCSAHCHGHTDLCVAREMLPMAKNMSKFELQKHLLEGSVDDAVCLKCANMTDGDRCESCILGHFRGTSTYTDVCRPCECHGHGDLCDPVTGEKCNCANNTESDNSCSAKYGKNASNFCWMSQCSKCKDTYVGHPTDGHQCYRQITVESKMCFDAKSIDECKIKPQPLRPGQTVFFMVQPRFMNVDIRIIVDVTQGELNFFMSPQDDSFIVVPDNQTGHQEIYLDTNYQWYKSYAEDTLSNDDILELMHINSPEFRYNNDNHNNYENITPSPLNADEKPHWPSDENNCKTMNGRKFLVKDQYAKDLSTYITLHHCNTLLRVYSLKNRLVLTLPQNAHNLSGTRFFIILKANPAASASYGLIFFRQDQLHIDLFVFFSVFFSCFFLFLAVCVVAWKAKQNMDIRRARRRHVVEMFNMARRPFAKITLSLGSYAAETPPHHRKRKKQPPEIPQSHQINAIAVEPTADNCAAVRTVFVRLPGKYKAPVRLALGSSMISINRNSFATSAPGSRTFLRRRGSHSNQQQQQIPLQIRD